METLGIIGLGYVGREVLPLSLERGFHVNAVDIDEETVSEIRSEYDTEGMCTSFYATDDVTEVIPDIDIVIVSVPTPHSSSSGVDLSAVESVADDIAKTMGERDGPLPVIIESTIPPGTVSEIIAPIFENHGHEIGKDVYLAHAPERIDPGNEDWPLEALPRVVAALTSDGTKRVAEFYERLLDAEVHQVESPQVAAAAKIIENAYRDINIAFVNEIALTLDYLDIDVSEALDAAETKPFGFNRFSPGAGVGGHCIPIDPYFLIQKANNAGYNNRFLKNAREINNYMPEYIAEKTIETLVRERILPQEARAVLLGKAFKPGVEDTRNSPYFTVRSKLEDYELDIETYDPQLPDESTIDSPYTEATVYVLLTAHTELCDLAFEQLAEDGVNLFVDARNEYSPEAVEKHGISYVGVGR